MNVTALIADDEPVARAGLRRMLGAFDWVTCVGETATGPATVAAINQLRPDVVFLDIQMPGLLGTEVAERIEHQPVIVFTTAFAQHAVAAFELGALDYLLKPFGAERLNTTMERLQAAVREPGAMPALARLRETLGEGPLIRLFVRSGASIVPVAVDDVSRFEAWGDYVLAFTGKTRHVLNLSLNHLAERLDPTRFVRIHRTHIVNLHHVVTFRRHGKGQLMAELKDGTQLVVSRSRAKAFRDLGV